MSRPFPVWSVGFRHIFSSAEELSQKAPQEAAQMQGQVAALKKFSDDIQELSSLENSLTEFYELSEINVGTFCENVMDKVKEYIKQDVTSSVNAPKLQVKTNEEQLERILLYLLKNAAFYKAATCPCIWAAS